MLVVQIFKITSHACSDFYAFWVCQISVLHKCFPISYVQPWSNHIVQCLYFIIFSHWSSCQTYLYVHQQILQNLPVLRSGKRLALIENDQSPRHIFQPLILWLYRLFSNQFAFQTCISCDVNSWTFVVLLPFEGKLGLSSQNDDLISWKALCPFLYLSFPLISTRIWTTHN